MDFVSYLPFQSYKNLQQQLKGQQEKAVQA